MPGRRMGWIASAALSLTLAVVLSAGRADRPVQLPEPPETGTRGPSALAFSSDGSTLYVAEQDTGDVAVLSVRPGQEIQVVGRVPSGGREPTGLAISADGGTLAVTNSFSGSVGLIDTAKRALRATVPVPGGPYAATIAGDRAFVAVSRIDQVAVVDLTTAQVMARIPVGRRPRALAITPDGRTLVCVNMAGGDLSLIDTTSLHETARVPVGAINLRGIAISKDSAHAYVTGQIAHNDLPTERPEAMWTNVLCDVGLAGLASRVERTIVLDDPDRGSADPYGVAVSGDTAWVALGGTHELAEVSLARAPRVARTLVGANPRAVVTAPDGSVWVANYLGNSLMAPRRSAAAPSTVDLGPPAQPDIRLHGRYLFNSAGLTRGEFFTCNTCHPDGNTEGLSWKFAHVHDGVDVRNSRNLRGGLLFTGPFGWTGRADDFEAFVSDEVQHLLRGPKLPHSELHAFWNFVNEFDLPPNPYRAADGALTQAAVRGRALFNGIAGCSACHGGELQGGTGKKEWIGTTPTGVKLDVPHLVGAYDSPPYLHDGRASTLEEIFTKYNPDRLHGRAHLLSPDQLRDVVEYVREL